MDEEQIGQQLIDLIDAEIGTEAGDDLRALVAQGHSVGMIMDAIAMLNDAEIPLPEDSIDALMKILDANT